MDKFTKRFYEKGNEQNKKSGGSFPQYPMSKAKGKALEKKKLKINHSPEKMLLYRTLKDKSDYSKMHIKATTITPTGKNKYGIK